MKQFFKFMFASMLGFGLVILITTLIFIGIIAAAVSKKEVVKVADNSILYITLNEDVTDRAPGDQFGGFQFGSGTFSKGLGLNQILKSIENAANDDNVKGIFIETSTIPAGLTMVEEIRNALLKFKTKGKFIVAYSEGYTQKTYYLASVADKIYLNPEGDLDFKGLVGKVTFFKGMLDKLDIEAQVIRHGKFKSAVEPFMNDKMSDASKEQTKAMIDAIWGHLLEGITQSRHISADSLKSIADNFAVQDASDAVKYKFVDKLAYKDEVLTDLASRVKVTEIDDLKFVKLAQYVDVPANKDSEGTGKGRIAVIYASGNIVSGEGDDGTIGSTTLSKAIRKARLDDKVKAVVLRVNSPGGSALASDVIWREVMLTKAVKPVVVSMGDVAASGGYYISCAANKIFASPNTITGSIGVFGIIPNMQQFFNKDLGVTFDEVKTNPYADYIPTTRPMTDSEKGFLTRDIENIYGTFVKHVSEGRKISEAQVDSIGQGRVWSGIDAKRIGLIDEFGGLNDAVAEAAKLAKLEKYTVINLPDQKDFFTKLMESFNGESRISMVKKELGPAYQYLAYLESMSKMQGIQALMPMMITIE